MVAFYLYIMATYQIPAPSPMSVKGDVAENWKDFENSWEYYVIATDLRSKLDNDEGKEIVAATLCTVMGADCKRIMNSLPSLSAADKKDPAKIVQELKKHFIPQRNVLFERFVFNSAVQKPGETIDEYVVRLRQMADSCEFGTLKDSLIRDRIVIGTTDEGDRERLFRERPVPTLEKAIESLRAFEISRTHKQVISGKEPEMIQHTEKRRNTYKPKGPRKADKQGEPKRSPKPRPQQRQSESCKWCGRKEDHTRKDCPAKDAKCHLCQKKGHFATVCQSSKCVNAVDKDDCFDSYYTMGEVSSHREDF